MKLHDLTVGQRFTFSDKHRGITEFAGMRVVLPEGE